MKLFSTGKTGVTLDTITHKLEKRKGGEAKVIDLTCRVQPFTSQHALAIDEIVKSALFQRTTGDPQNHVDRLAFRLPVPRQQVEIFSTPDTAKASILFDQVKVSGLMARVEKGLNGYALVFHLTFGPVSKQELEFVEKWRTEMRFLSFDESEPSLDLEEPEEEETHDEEETTTRQPMFDTDKEGRELVGAATATGPAAPDRANRRPLSHAAGRRGRGKA